MGHLADGVLRRMHDEPLASTDAAKRHLAGCKRCQARFEVIAADARRVAAALASPHLALDRARALARLREAVAASGVRPQPSRLQDVLGRLQLRSSSGVRWTGALAIAMLLIVGLVATGAAQGMYQVFEPKQFTAVPVTQSDVSMLPNLSAYGTEKWETKPQPHQVASFESAASETGLALRRPSSLPSDIPAAVQYQVQPLTKASFTFSADKARQEAARQGKAAPAMPSNIDGSTLYLSAGPAAAFVYGGDEKMQSMPTLLIAESKAPVLSSSGVTAQELQNYLLSQPGISPDLAAQIRAIGDPSGTLPIPIPVTMATSRSVDVDGGAKGLLVGDRTGLGSVVIWQKGGVVYAVGGTLPDTEVLAIANSLR